MKNLESNAFQLRSWKVLKQKRNGPREFCFRTL